MKCDQLFKWLGETMLTEGGKVFKTTSSIPQNLIELTLNDIYNEILNPLGLKLRGTDWDLLGSAGKKTEPSNDLDIAVRDKSLDELVEFLQPLPYEHKKLTGLDLVTLAYPIHGTEESVQLDLMATDNMDFTTWAYHSPSELESKYNGTYRNALLEAIASEIKFEVIDTFDDGKHKTIKKEYYSFSRGLMERTDSYVGKKGKPIKRPVTLERSLISKDPKKISAYLLGEGTTRDDTNSFESVFTRMNSESFPHKGKMDEIRKKFSSIMTRKKLTIPEEMRKLNMSNFKNYSDLDNVSSMRRIPHFDQMTIPKLTEFLDQAEFSFSEKMDGSNFSVGVLDGKIFGKSKKARANFDSNSFFQNKDINDVFIGMGNLMKQLELDEFPAWYNKILHNCLFDNIQIFGEMFYSNQVNAIVYKTDKIGGKGAFVVFGVTADGDDISHTEMGEKIMIKFAHDFSAFNLPIYTKHDITVDLEEDKIDRIKKYLDLNLETLKSRRSTPEHRAEKAEAVAGLKILLKDFKNDVLGQLGETESMLGGYKLEGLVMRNTNNGAISKLVDIEEFTALNSKNWAGRDALKKSRKDLFKNIITDACKDCDILVIPAKQDESLNSYLSITQKPKFDNETELLSVLADEVGKEVDMTGSPAKLSDLIAQYVSDLSSTRTLIDNRQFWEDTKLDDKHYKDTLNMYDMEIKGMEEFTKRILKMNTPQPEIVKFVLGKKVMEKLSKKFL